MLCAITLQAQNFTGTWNTSFGDVKLIHEGQIVYGDYSSIGIIDAIQTGYNINGKFTNNGKVGEFYFKLASDNKSFTGEWKWQGDTKNQGNWTGTLKSDSFPDLKMDKWTGQYEFNAYPGVFTKKLNLQQKGFNLSGKFDDGKSFIAKLDTDLKTVGYGSFYNGNTQYNLYKSYIKTENNENITVWYGQIGKTNTSEKIKFSAKFLKPMSTAEFKSISGSNTASTNILQGSGSSTNISTSVSTTTSTKKIRYRLTLDKIYASIVDDGPGDDTYELFGIAWCRAYDNDGKQLTPFDVTYSDNYGRFWEIPAKDYVNLGQRQYNELYEIKKQITFDFPVNNPNNIEEVLKNSKIELTVELKDVDNLSSYDILGKERVTIPLNEANIKRIPNANFKNHLKNDWTKGVFTVKHGSGGIIYVFYYIEKI
jgi:hypothetical protein